MFFLFIFPFLYVILYFQPSDVSKIDVSKVINEQGCLQAIEEWIEKNMIPLASCAIFILFFQVS